MCRGDLDGRVVLPVPGPGDVGSVDEPVPPGLLGRVHRPVGRLKRLLRRGSLSVSGQARAEGHALPGPGVSQLLDGHGAGVAAVDGEHHGELFPAVPRDAARRRAVPEQQPSEGLQGPVPVPVPEGVVDALEVVQVEQQDAATGRELLELLDEGAPVRQTGQRVRHGQVSKVGRLQPAAQCLRPVVEEGPPVAGKRRRLGPRSVPPQHQDADVQQRDVQQARHSEPEAQGLPRGVCAEPVRHEEVLVGRQAVGQVGGLRCVVERQGPAVRRPRRLIRVRPHRAAELLPQIEVDPVGVPQLPGGLGNDVRRLGRGCRPGQPVTRLEQRLQGAGRSRCCRQHALNGHARVIDTSRPQVDGQKRPRGLVAWPPVGLSAPRAARGTGPPPLG